MRTRNSIVVVLCAVLLGGLMVAVNCTSDSSKPAPDGDTVAEQDEEGYRYIGCTEEFDPMAAPARQYTIAPYAVNPTADGVTIVWEAMDNAPGFILWGKGDTLDTVTCVNEPEKIAVASEDVVETHEGWLFSVTLTGLEAHTWYGFDIPNAETPVPSVDDVYLDDMHFEDFSGGEFVTAALPGQSFTITILGDNQALPNQHQQVVATMQQNITDVAVHLGDMVHDGLISQFRGNYLLMGSPALRRIAHFYVAGNHEGHGDAIPYDSLFKMPAAAPVMIDGVATSPGKRTYTADYGNVRFFILDSELPMTEGSVQSAWLEDQLSNTISNDTDITFLFCAWHRPTFSWGDGRRSTPKDHIQAMMKRWKVDAVFNGHDHNYQRFVQDGIPYIVSGGAGAFLTSIEPERAEPGDNYVAGEMALHIMVGDITSQEASFRVIRSPDGAIIDTFSLLAQDRSALR